MIYLLPLLLSVVTGSVEDVERIRQSYLRESGRICEIHDSLDGITVEWNNPSSVENDIFAVFESGRIYDTGLVRGMCAMIPTSQVGRVFAQIHAICGSRWLQRLLELKARTKEALAILDNDRANIPLFIQTVTMKNLERVDQLREFLRQGIDMTVPLPDHSPENDAILEEATKIIASLAFRRSSPHVDAIMNKLAECIAMAPVDDRMKFVILERARARVIRSAPQFVSQTLSRRQFEKFQVSSMINELHGQIDTETRRRMSRNQ
jgi:hypothetical protein